MEVDVRRLTSWADALDSARETVGKPPLHKEPSSEWKTRILVAGHSPARTVMFAIRFTGIKSWVSVHLERHSKFAEHFVSTQRPDRTGANVNRDELPQGALVNHTIVTNAMEIIAISKKRLCRLAAPETRGGGRQGAGPHRREGARRGVCTRVRGTWPRMPRDERVREVPSARRQIRRTPTARRVGACAPPRRAGL